MRRRKISLRIFSCAANDGKSRPTSKPTSIAKKIQNVRLRLRMPASASERSAIHLTTAVATWPGTIGIKQKPRVSRAKAATWSKATERSAVRTLVGMDDFGPRHLSVLARRARDFSSDVNRLANLRPSWDRGAPEKTGG